MLTAVDDDETVLESIQAGADGYLTKDRAVDEVVGAVRAAHAGETLLPRSVIVGIAQRVAAARERGRAPADRAADAARARGPARADARASRRREICERLFIAPNTLRTHVQNIMGKLQRALEARGGRVRPPLPAGGAAAPGGPPLPRAPAADRGPPASYPAGRRAASRLADPPDRRWPLAGRSPAAPRRSPAGRARHRGSCRRRSLAPLELAPLGVEERAAARAAPFLGEQGLDR